jgi:hypothetical protein
MGSLENGNSKRHRFDDAEKSASRTAFGCGGIFSYDAKEGLRELKPAKSVESGPSSASPARLGRRLSKESPAEAGPSGF